MSDLRQFAAELIANPLVPVPPIEGVVARARHYRAARRRRQVGAGVCLVAMTLMAMARAGVGVGDRDSLRMVGDPGSEDESGISTSSGSVPEGTSTTFPTLPWSGHTFDGDWSSLRSQRTCDVIRPPKPELEVLIHEGESGYRTGETAKQLIDRVNSEGGICGRWVKLVYGSAERAKLQDYVAVLGLPLDDDIDNAIRSGDIEGARIPVVTGDGLSDIHHRSRWVYPVGPSAGSLTRMAVAHARQKGAATFAILYDADRTFGREAAESFDRSVQSEGGTPKASIPLDPSATTYAPEADRLAEACGVEGCDFVFLAVTAHAAQQWMATNPVKPRVQLAGLSTVLSDGFSDHCTAEWGRHCDGLIAWSGYVPRPPAGQSNDDAKAAYGESNGSALREGAFLATRVLVEALDRAGPYATRATVAKALDSMTYTSRIAAPLSWAAASYRWGNPVAQAWVLRTSGIVPHAPMPPSTTTTTLPSNKQEVEREAARYGDYTRISVPNPGWYSAGTGWVRDPG